MRKVAIKGISNEFTKILNEYKDEIADDMLKSREEIAKKTVKQLKKTSPKRKTKGGSYAKGWRITNEKGKMIIHNKTNYQLTHLLEHGHAKVNGGRVAAIVHIKPAEEFAIKEFIEETERVIKR